MQKTTTLLCLLVCSTLHAIPWTVVSQHAWLKVEVLCGWCLLHSAALLFLSTNHAWDTRLTRHVFAQVQMTLVDISQAQCCLMIQSAIPYRISCQHGSAHLCQAGSMLLRPPFYPLEPHSRPGPARPHSGPGIMQAWGQVAGTLGPDFTHPPSASTWATHQGGARAQTVPPGGQAAGLAPPLAAWQAPTEACQALAAA